MISRFLTFAFFFLLYFAEAQNEFITIWQPGITTTPVQTVDAPFQANANQIWFPGIGQNYTIEWEEVGYSSNNGTMINVTSTSQVLIDFGPTREEGQGATTKYRVKVSNGNGTFQQFKSVSYQIIGTVPANMQSKGSLDKLLEIEQWGNINWTSMDGAFANCQRVLLTATDSPNLTNVTDASLMFYLATSFSGAPSMQNWDTSNIEIFKHMFDCRHTSQVYSSGETFNSPIGTWNVSAATDLSYMFAGRQHFNQNLNFWNVSNVTNMAWMFAVCPVFNQPLNNWNTSSLENIEFMFFLNHVFNQPLNNWDTSQVIKMNSAFSFATSFNQPLDSWDVSSVTTISAMFSNASSFNQSLGSWDLSSLVNGLGPLYFSAINCQNYSATLAGWADNPNTPDNIDFGNNTPAQYAANVVNKRDFLINTKNWTISGDTQGSCILSTVEIKNNQQILIYPNPTSDFIYLNQISDAKKYQIIDFSGRLVKHGELKEKWIDVKSLTNGNYILIIKTKEKELNFKFIKD